MKGLPRFIIQAFADVSINLASAWIAVLLISPGLFGVSPGKYIELLTWNFTPAILALGIGVLLSKKSAEL